MIWWGDEDVGFGEGVRFVLVSGEFAGGGVLQVVASRGTTGGTPVTRGRSAR